MKLEKLHKTKHQSMNANFKQVVQRANFAKNEHQFASIQKYKEDC